MTSEETCNESRPRRTKLSQLGILFVAVIMISGSLGFLIGAADGPSGFETEVGPGALVQGASYTIYEDSGTTYARNGSSGQTTYSSANATSVFQQVIDELSSGGKIAVREGHYSITTSLLFDDDAWHPSIVGEGHNTQLEATGDFPLIYVVTENPQGFNNPFLKDLQLLGGGFASTLVSFPDYGFGQNIENVRFSSTSSYAILFNYVAYGCHNIFIKNCDFGACGDSTHPSIYSQGWASHIRIEGCTWGALGTGQTEIIKGHFTLPNIVYNHIECGTNTATYINITGYGPLIEGNKFAFAETAVLFYGSCFYGRVVGNAFISNTNDYVAHYGAGWSYSAGVIIADNSVNDFTNGFVLGNITLAYSDGLDSVISRNTFYDAKAATSNCLTLFTDRVSIIGNTVYAVGTANTFAKGYNNKGVVTGNTFGAFSTFNYLIDTLAYSVKWLVDANTIGCTLTTGFTNDFDDITFGENIGYVTKNTGTATISATTFVTFNHEMAITPTLVLASFNAASYGNYTWTATSTQITITVSTSGTYTVTWYAEV